VLNDSYDFEVIQIKNSFNLILGFSFSKRLLNLITFSLETINFTKD